MGHFLRHPYLRLANTAASGSDWSQMAWCRSGWDQGPETLTVPQFPPLRRGRIITLTFEGCYEDSAS